MADIKPTLDAIDEAIDGYVTWHGSGDAAVWSAEGDRGDEVLAWIDEHLNTGWQLTEWQRDLIRQAYSPVATGGIVRNPLRMLEAGSTRYWPAPRLEPSDVTHVSINGVDVTDMVRSVTLDNSEATFTPNGIVTTTPDPPADSDVLTNLSAAYRRIAELDRPERTVVAAPATAAWIEDLGITVIESPHVPEGQVYVINQPAITGQMFSEPMSYSFDQDVATYRFGMRFIYDRPRPTFEADPWKAYMQAKYHKHNVQALVTFDEWLAIGRKVSAQRLHRAYRHRCLARRRRNR